MIELKVGRIIVNILTEDDLSMIAEKVGERLNKTIKLVKMQEKANLTGRAVGIEKEKGKERQLIQELLKEK